MYVIQYLMYPSWRNKWAAAPKQYNTLKEAQAAYDALQYNSSDHRIAEVYTATRYKPLKYPAV